MRCWCQFRAAPNLDATHLPGASPVADTWSAGTEARSLSNAAAPSLRVCHTTSSSNGLRCRPDLHSPGRGDRCRAPPFIRPPLDNLRYVALRACSRPQARRSACAVARTGSAGGHRRSATQAEERAGDRQNVDRRMIVTDGLQAVKAACQEPRPWRWPPQHKHPRRCPRFCQREAWSSAIRELCNEDSLHRYFAESAERGKDFSWCAVPPRHIFA